MNKIVNLILTIFNNKYIYDFDIAHKEQLHHCGFVLSHKLNDDDYAEVVSKLIRSRYSADMVEATLANYMQEKSEEHIEEFNDFSDWRQACKEAAHELINNSND